jgi:hypothetical protein
MQNNEELIEAKNLWGASVKMHVGCFVDLGVWVNQLSVRVVGDYCCSL